MKNSQSCSRTITIAAVCVLVNVQQTFSLFYDQARNPEQFEGQAHYGNRMKHLTVLSHAQASFSGYIPGNVYPQLLVPAGPKDSTLKSFYKDCGTTTRQCSWIHQYQQRKVAMNRPHHPHRQQEPGNAFTTTNNNNLPPMEKQVDVAYQPVEQEAAEQICTVYKNICVGNTEACVSNHNCDAAMRITEVSTEGKSDANVRSVAYLNNCELDGMTLADGPKMPQVYFGIGFATYDANGNLECRTPKASDFKLIFIWKNASAELGDPSRRVCKSKMENDYSAVNLYDSVLMNSMTSWTNVCNKDKAQENSGFSLKSFMVKHVVTSQYTPYFKAPFEFADNLETQATSNGMVVTGIVPE